jgi:glycerol-3-phosphate acyltransferase PlsY
MTLILCPVHFLSLLLVFAIIVVISRYVSLGSIVVATLLPISVCLYIPFVCGVKLSMVIAISIIFLGGFVVWCHRSNIKRLLAGNEKKISIGGKKK